jgi:hypothetical protein
MRGDWEAKFQEGIRSPCACTTQNPRRLLDQNLPATPPTHCMTSHNGPEPGPLTQQISPRPCCGSPARLPPRVRRPDRGTIEEVFVS